MHKILQQSGLDTHQLEALENMSTVAEFNDCAAPPIYWNLIDKERNTEGDLLYTKGEHDIIGYLGFFLFEPHTAEVTALVDPAYRNQGIFSELLDIASSELRKIGVNTLSLRAPANVISTQHTLKKLDACFDFSEYRLICEQPVYHAVPRPFHIVQANQDLLEEVLRLHQLHYYSQEEQIQIRAHFKNMLEAKHRKCFIAYYQHQAVGILHARDDTFEVILHDFNFIENHKATPLKFLFLNQVLLKLRQENSKPFSFTLKDNQWACFEQFSRYGFEIRESIEYWNIPLAEHQRTVRRNEKLVN